MLLGKFLVGVIFNFYKKLLSDTEKQKPQNSCLYKMFKNAVFIF